jgi:DNA-binding NtrC family response regulator
VLPVEDDVQVASLTSAMLVELGCEVIPVTSAHAALEELSKSLEIGLVLSDIMMPGGMDGIELGEKEGITAPAKPHSLHDLAQKIRATAGKNANAFRRTNISAQLG